MPISATAQAELERTPPPCDRCRASALVIVQRADVRPPFELSFCGHHFSVHEPMLAASGWGVVADARTQLSTRERTRKRWPW